MRTRVVPDYGRAMWNESERWAGMGRAVATLCSVPSGSGSEGGGQEGIGNGTMGGERERGDLSISLCSRETAQRLLHQDIYIHSFVVHFYTPNHSSW